MQSKFYHIANFLFFIGIGITQAQTTASDTLSNEVLIDSISKPVNKKPLLLAEVKYTAKDCVQIDRKNNKLILYNEAELYYQDIELRAGIIILDYKTNEVNAGRIELDSTLVQYPFFKQGSNEVNPDSIRFNFDTQKALIWNSKSGQNGMDIFAALTKKQNDSVYFIKDARVSTAGKLVGGEDEGIDYYFKVRKGKIIPGGKIISGITNMFIADVPTPVGVPFAYFPSSQSKESGFIIPSIGESNLRGFYVQNGGYYLALSDYFDFTLIADYYTNGSYGFRGDTQYNVRYKYRGTFSFRYENLINEERGLPNYSKSTVFNVRWNHSKDAKSSPNSTFSASVNFGSSDYYRQSVNQLNSPNFLNNNLSSSISYSKTFPEYPRVNISLTTAMSQNSQSKSVNLTLPTFQANMERIYPFAPKVGTKKGFFQNINFQYTSRAENRIITTEDALFGPNMFDNAKTGMKHSIPLSTNFKIFKYLSMSTSANYEEVWTQNTVRFSDYNPELGVAVKDTINKIGTFRQYNLSASLGTTIYGTFNFGENKKIQTIRHTIRPSISYTNRPSFEKYYDTYIVDAEGNSAEYTRYQNSLFGVPSKSLSNSMGISLGNNFEAKVRDNDSTATGPKKIVLLNNLNISTSHNFAADSLRWSPMRLSSGFSFLKNKMSVNFGTTFDPYTLNENKVRINKYHITNGGGLFRMTSANVNMNYSFSSSQLKGDGRDQDEEDQNERTQRESTSSGGREDDLFGRAEDFTDRRMTDDENSGPTPTYPSYRSKIPWDIKLAYSLTYVNSTGQRDFSNNSLMFSGNVDLTPKWKVGMSSGYDFKGKGFTYTQLRFNRDLNSWRLNFSWVPFSERASWNFFIGIKSGLLSDIKYEKQSEPNRR
ncbi:putative LPS assembly protein LptD [Flavobacteriaceae bacterium]|nr:putative LPS assembly protein LptD [Flavobacteriaceae bacterium]MDB3862002.1 putative LPS assembly protein LptD [Flavobacteriaceae bacterium]